MRDTKYALLGKVGVLVVLLIFLLVLFALYLAFYGAIAYVIVKAIKLALI